MSNERSADERIARLETSVESIHAEFGEVRSALSGIQATLAKNRETNWSVIFSGIAIVGAIYAAAIRPIERDLMRQDQAADTISKAVVTRDAVINEIKQTQVIYTNRLGILEDTLRQIRAEGSPITDKRLTILELKTKDLKP